MKNMWTKTQKEAASEAMEKKNENDRGAKKLKAMRVPIGGSRNITSVNDTPEGFVDRWVNDTNGRVERFKRAGYENVASASIGDSGVDASHSESGVVSRDMGLGTTAYLMRQSADYYKEDQLAKQNAVDVSEEAIRRDVDNKLSDGHYGKVTIQN